MLKWFKFILLFMFPTFKWHSWSVVGAGIQTHVWLPSITRLLIAWKGLSFTLGDSFRVLFSVKGRLTLGWGVMLGHVILHHNGGGARCRESCEWGSQLENQKRKTWLLLAENSCFLELTRALIPFLVTSHSIPIGRQLFLMPFNLVKTLPSSPAQTLAKE